MFSNKGIRLHVVVLLMEVAIEDVRLRLWPLLPGPLLL